MVPLRMHSLPLSKSSKWFVFRSTARRARIASICETQSTKEGMKQAPAVALYVATPDFEFSQVVSG